MSAKFYVGISVLVCIVALISLGFAQTGSPITDQWSIGGLVVRDRVLLTIQCFSGIASNMSSSMPVPLAQFHGLGRAQLESSGSVAQFEIVRDAGTRDE